MRVASDPTARRLLNPHMDVNGYPVYFESELSDYGGNNGAPPSLPLRPLWAPGPSSSHLDGRAFACAALQLKVERSGGAPTSGGKARFAMLAFANLHIAVSLGTVCNA